jgi:hypothetical protein
VTQETDAWAQDPAGSAEDRVEVLAQVEAAIAAARGHRAALEYGPAIRELSIAERDVLSRLDIAGASAWYAEVQLALAVTAMESGHEGAAEAALARACSVDPARTLGGAEAPPSLVARARSILRAIATGPRGRFELRTNVEGALVTVDERPLGRAPLRVEASVGTHVLRVEAPGHRPWARAIDVLEGSRRAIEVVLAPEPAVEHVRALRAAADARDLDGVVASLGALAAIDRAPRALWLVEASGGALDRAIVVACRASGCSEPIRIDATRVESVLPRDPEAAGEPLDPGAIASARSWLDEPIDTEPPPPPGTPWWEEPWPWVVLGTVALGAIGVSIGVTWPQPRTVEQFRIECPDCW